MYSEPSQAFIVELFAKIVNGFSINCFHKKLHNKCWAGS